MKRIALALALALGWGEAALAQQTPAPNAAPPNLNPSGPASGAASRPALPPPLPPRADGVPADMAFGAYQRGNFLYALMEAERRLDANPKDAAAMTLIGEIYRDGAAVSRDEREASRWYRLASNLGDPQAAYELGVLQLQGANGVTKDTAAAKAQFERERGGDACQMSMDRHRFRKRCERLTNGGNIHVLCGFRRTRPRIPIGSRPPIPI